METSLVRDNIAKFDLAIAGKHSAGFTHNDGQTIFLEQAADGTREITVLRPGQHSTRFKVNEDGTFDLKIQDNFYVEELNPHNILQGLRMANVLSQEEAITKLARFNSTLAGFSAWPIFTSLIRETLEKEPIRALSNNEKAEFLAALTLRTIKAGKFNFETPQIDIELFLANGARAWTSISVLTHKAGELDVSEFTFQFQDTQTSEIFRGWTRVGSTAVVFPAGKHLKSDAEYLMTVS